jgi:hypothetical protein
MNVHARMRELAVDALESCCHVVEARGSANLSNAPRMKIPLPNSVDWKHRGSGDGNSKGRTRLNASSRPTLGASPYQAKVAKPGGPSLCLMIGCVEYVYGRTEPCPMAQKNSVITLGWTQAPWPAALKTAVLRAGQAG